GATAVWNDADLANRFAMRHQFSHQCMARLVVCNRGSFLLVHHPALFLGTRNHPFDGSLEIIQRDCRSLVPGSEECRLIHGIRQISPADTSRYPGGPLQVKVRRQLHILAMNFQDLHSADKIRIADGDLAVKASRALKCRVEHFRTVGGSHDDYRSARIGLEAVDLRQQLVQGLFALVIASQAHYASPALTNGINLVNENDRGSGLTRLLEQVAHTCGAHANEHLDELGATGLEERDPGLASRSFGQESLSCAWRADEQYSLWNMSTELGKL